MKCHHAIDAADHAVHQCNDDDVKATELITQTTKPCPTCATPTSRISGCPQMWCTMCHTAWTWTTGDVDTSGVVHNPHYYEWTTAHPAQQPGPQPDQCGGWQGIFAKFQQWKTKQHVVRILTKFHRRALHLRAGALRALAPRNDNTDIRLKYLAGELSECQFKVRVQKREKKHSCNVALRHIVEFVVETTQDIFTAMAAADQAEAAHVAHAQLVNMEHYATQQLRVVSKRFGTVEKTLGHLEAMHPH
jgi:hypothetical protein